MVRPRADGSFTRMLKVLRRACGLPQIFRAEVPNESHPSNDAENAPRTPAAESKVGVWSPPAMGTTSGVPRFQSVEERSYSVSLFQ